MHFLARRELSLPYGPGFGRRRSISSSISPLPTPTVLLFDHSTRWNTRTFGGRCSLGDLFFVGPREEASRETGSYRAGDAADPSLPRDKRKAARRPACVEAEMFRKLIITKQEAREESASTFRRTESLSPESSEPESASPISPRTRPNRRARTAFLRIL